MPQRKNGGVDFLNLLSNRHFYGRKNCIGIYLRASTMLFVVANWRLHDMTSENKTSQLKFHRGLTMVLLASVESQRKKYVSTAPEFIEGQGQTIGTRYQM